MPHVTTNSVFCQGVDTLRSRLEMIYGHCDPFLVTVYMHTKEFRDCESL